MFSKTTLATILTSRTEQKQTFRKIRQLTDSQLSIKSQQRSKRKFGRKRVFLDLIRVTIAKSMKMRHLLLRTTTCNTVLFKLKKNIWNIKLIWSKSKVKQPTEIRQKRTQREMKFKRRITNSLITDRISDLSTAIRNFKNLMNNQNKMFKVNQKKLKFLLKLTLKIPDLKHLKAVNRHFKVESIRWGSLAIVDRKSGLIKRNL